MNLDEVNNRKQPTAVITFRVPLHMKADATKYAADQGKNMNQWAAHAFAQILSDKKALSFDWDKQRTIIIDNLKADKDKLSKQVAKLQADLKTVTADATKSANKAQKTASNESKLKDDAKQLSRSLKSLESKYKALEGKSAKLGEELASVRAELKKQKDANSQALVRLKDDSKKIVDLQKRVDLANKIFTDRRVKDREKSGFIKDVFIKV